METIYDESFRRSLTRELAKAVSAAVTVLLLGVAADFYILLESRLTVIRAFFGAAVTGAALFVLAWIWQKRLLPLHRVRRLLSTLDPARAEDVAGIFRGYSEALGTHGGIFIRKLRVDAGDRFRNQCFEREVEMPAVCADAPFTIGDRVELKTVENMVVAASPSFSAGPINTKKGAHALPLYVCAGILLGSALLWLGFYTGASKRTAEPAPRLAVCAPAHNEEMDGQISEAAGVEIGYSNTLDNQDVSLYLATYGTFEADIILLGETYFEGVYGGEAAPLDTAAIETALGFAPKYRENAEGEKTALVLYDPEDEAYNTLFPGLYDWFAVESGTPMLLMVRDGSPFAGSGETAEAVSEILKIICEK